MMLVVLVIGKCGSNIPIDLLWQAILGVTDQYFRDNLSEAIYNDCCEKLRVSSGMVIVLFDNFVVLVSTW